MVGWEVFPARSTATTFRTWVAQVGGVQLMVLPMVVPERPSGLTPGLQVLNPGGTERVPSNIHSEHHTPDRSSVEFTVNVPGLCSLRLVPPLGNCGLVTVGILGGFWSTVKLQWLESGPTNVPSYALVHQEYECPLVRAGVGIVMVD